MKPNPIVGQGTPLHQWQASALIAELPEVSVEQLVPPGCRAVIIAPHPDDEVLGSGGLLQGLAALGRPMQLISVTNGSASHPGSRRWPAERLSIVRPQESAQALHRLGLPLHSLKWLRTGFSDSQVAAREEQLVAFIRRYLKPNDVVFTTWREDGHCDHEAVGRASARAAEAVGVALYELPVWTWHWATPEDSLVPWHRARKIPLTPEAVARKRHAIHAFASQLEGDPQIGLAPVLAPYVMERLLQPFDMSVATPYFDQLFAGNDDPWAFRQRWYEQRKRALTLAILTRPHYASVFEPGCANGELSAELALRCDRLLCCDTASAAVALAKTRLLEFPHAQVLQSRLPEQWPTGQFDLIVLSELCYYLDADDLQRMIDLAITSLSPDGQLLACHWRPAIEGCPQTAEQVHALLHQRLAMQRIAHHHDHDFLLDLWSRDGTSVATLEGLR